jgi:hypothetical protein
MFPKNASNYFAGGVCPDVAGLAAAAPAVAGLFVLECFFVTGLLWACDLPAVAPEAVAGAVAGFAGVVVVDCARAAAAPSMETNINFFISLSFFFLPKSVERDYLSPSQTHHAANTVLGRSHP